MNKQEIIDNLRLEIRDKDFALIDLTARLKAAIELLRLASRQLTAECLKSDISEFLNAKQLEITNE